MRTSKQYFRLALALGCALALLAARASAQDTLQNGTVLGTVTDASPAALPGVPVEDLRPLAADSSFDGLDSEGKVRFVAEPAAGHVTSISFRCPGFSARLRDGFRSRWVFRRASTWR